MTVEQDVSRHYTQGNLQEAVLKGLQALGRAPGHVRPEDLSAIDEFHMGGQQATTELAERLRLEQGTRLLDIGSGLGGPARFFARRYGCQVTGIDLTPEYVEVAQNLTRMVGLEGSVTYRVGSATSLPFGDGSFDVATLLHVGMNIPDKDRLFGEAARVLRRGGVFGVYDVMRVSEGELEFPVAWAASPTTSFLVDAAGYRRGLEAAGFTVESERSQRDLALAFFARLRARIAQSGPPPLGLHILMGADARAKIANLIGNLEAGRIAP
ncbi:MAG TPA: methyltransferase domain-containing protein, partial [Alphaproteobacteria bacterium]|nr:methyltransferase domain-containing protein [Alphaproteobacteria bacterium]